MRLVAAFLAVAVALTLGGCSRRDRSNPFDPGNPATGGRPSGFVAEAGNTFIVLRWRKPPAIEFEGFRLQRRFEGETEFRTIAALLAPSSTSFGDFGLRNGRRHEYRLAFVFADGPAPIAAEDFATPGTLRPWLTDVGSGELLQLSADGRRVVGADPGFVSPVHLAVDPVTGRVWVGDSYTGDVTLLTISGNRDVITSQIRPAGIAVDPRSLTAWVCDERLGEVAHFLPSGEHATPPRIGPLDVPLDVAIDPGDGTVWVCEYGAQKVRAYRSDGVQRFAAPAPRPSRVAVDSLTHDAWVTSFDRGLLVRFSAAGFATDTVTGFRGPIGVAVDSRRGRIWVADAIGGEVVTVGRDARIENRFRGHSQAREIALDLATGNAWITEPGARRLVVLSPAGAEVTVLGGLDQPYDVAVDPGNVLSSALAAALPAEFAARQGASTTLRVATRPPSVSRTR